jgi:hypothetical protein
MGLRKVLLEKYQVAPSKNITSFEVVGDDPSPAIRLKESLSLYFASDGKSLPSIPGCEIVIDASPSILHGKECYELLGAKFRYLAGTSEADLDEVRKILTDNGLVRIL